MTHEQRALGFREASRPQDDLERSSQTTTIQSASLRLRKNANDVRNKLPLHEHFVKLCGLLTVDRMSRMRSPVSEILERDTDHEK